MEQGLKQLPTQNGIHSHFCRSWCLHSFPQPGSYHPSHLQYVDNALFMGSNHSYLKFKKQEFMKKWESRDLEEAKEYLGMWITRDHIKKTLKLDQISYSDKVVKHFKLNDAKIACTPLPSGYNPMPNMTQSTPHLRSRYQSVIGSLLYIMLGTRPDVAQAVIKMS